MPTRLKKGVRARMAMTGESYQEALRGFRALLTSARRRKSAKNRKNPMRDVQVICRRSPRQRSAA
jgi:hypothetical protein